MMSRSKRVPRPFRAIINALRKRARNWARLPVPQPQLLHELFPHPSSSLFLQSFPSSIPSSQIYSLLFYPLGLPIGVIEMGKPKDSTAATATPARAPPSLKKQNSSSSQPSGQRSIQSFFSRAPANGTLSSSNGILKANDSKNANAMAKPTVPVKKPAFKKTAVKNMTPVPSSDAMGPSSSQENENGGIPEEVEDTGLPSPSTPAKRVQQVVNGNALVLGSSPSRKVYANF